MHLCFCFVLDAVFSYVVFGVVFFMCATVSLKVANPQWWCNLLWCVGGCGVRVFVVGAKFDSSNKLQNQNQIIIKESLILLKKKLHDKSLHLVIAAW